MRSNRNYLEMANELEVTKRELEDSRAENSSMRRFMIRIQEENNELRKEKGPNANSSQPRTAFEI